jgi:hypothetical protein
VENLSPQIDGTAELHSHQVVSKIVSRVAKIIIIGDEMKPFFGDDI